MATEQDIFDFAVSQNPNLKSKPFRDVVDFAYSQNPKLRDAVVTATPQSPMAQSSFAAGKMGGIPQTNIAPLEFAEKAIKTPGVLPAAGMMAAGTMAAPVTAGLSLPMAIAGGAALAGYGAGAGELARQKISGEGMDIGKAGVEAGIGAAGEGIVRGIFAGGQVLVNAIKENPFIRKGVSKLLASSSAGKESWANIAKAIDRGVGKDIPGYEKKVNQIIEGTKKASVSEMPIIEKDAVGTLSNLQNQLKNLRELSGKQVAKVDANLIKLATAKGKTIDTTDIGQDLFSFTQDLRQAGMADIPQAKTIIETLEKEAISIANNPTVSVKDAITKKKAINKIFSDFKTGYMDVAQNTVVNEKMMMVAKRLSDKVSTAASDLGYKEYGTAYKNFGEFANHYDLEIAPLVASDKGQAAVLKKFQGIANNLNTQSLKNELLEDTAKKLPKGLSKNILNPVINNINKVTDQGVLYNLYRDLASSQSSELVGKYRLLLGPMTKGYVRWAGNVAPVATSPTITAPLIRGVMGNNEQK